MSCHKLRLPLFWEKGSLWDAEVWLRCQVWLPCEEGGLWEQRAGSPMLGASAGAQSAARLGQAGARDICIVPWLLLGFLPAWVASDYRLQLLIISEGGLNLWGIKAVAFLFWTLCPLGVYCWLSRPTACFLQQAQQQPVSSKQVEIKTLNLVCLYRPLRENSNQNWFNILGLNIEFLFRTNPQRIQCTC